jgi:hypothetical protein
MTPQNTIMVPERQKQNCPASLVTPEREFETVGIGTTELSKILTRFENENFIHVSICPRRTAVRFRFRDFH